MTAPELPGHPGVDSRILTSGGIAFRPTTEALDATAHELARLGYRVVRLDARGWHEHAVLHDDLAAGLGLPPHHGRNLDALSDCLGDVAAYVGDRSGTGLAVVVDGFGAWAARDARTAGYLLEDAAGASRTGLGLGLRVLWVLRSDDAAPTSPPDADAPAADAGP